MCGVSIKALTAVWTHTAEGDDGWDLHYQQPLRAYVSHVAPGNQERLLIYYSLEEREKMWNMEPEGGPWPDDFHHLFSSRTISSN